MNLLFKSYYLFLSYEYLNCIYLFQINNGNYFCIILIDLTHGHIHDKRRNLYVYIC